MDGELRKPRYTDLTLEKLKASTELQLGGHRKSDKKHLYVKPEELKHLVPLTNLRKLHLGENDGVTDEALVYVGQLKDVEELVLWDSPITDAGVKHLVPLTKLTSLDLAFATKIGTPALTDISRMTSLEKLVLSGTQVDDVSLLTKLPRLRVLQLGQLQPRGLDALQKANPQLQVIAK